jgi:hypothetical protein
MECRIGFELEPGSEAHRKRSKQMAIQAAGRNGSSYEKAAFSRMAAIERPPSPRHSRQRLSPQNENNANGWQSYGELIEMY